MNLADGSVHGLVKLLHCEAKESIAAHELCLFFGFLDLCVGHRCFPLRDANQHVLLGLEHREDNSGFSPCRNCLNQRVRRTGIQAENPTKDMLRVEGREQGHVAANADSSHEKLVGAASHCTDLPLNDLLYIGEALRLYRVLALSVPCAASSFLFVFLKDDGALDYHHVDKFVKAEDLFACLAEKGVDVGLWVLTMIMQEDARCSPRVHKTAIWCGNGLEHDVVANVVLEEAVLGRRFF